MTGEGWRKLAKGLGIGGAIAGAATAASAIIKAVKPEARDLPSEYSSQIREMVIKTMAEEKQKSGG